MSVVAIIGPRNSGDIFDVPHRALVDAGHEVVHFEGRDAFLASGEILANSEVILAAGDVRVDRMLLMAAPRVRGVVCPTTGTEGFDETAATDLGVIVANGQTPENYQSMAEATLMLMLAVSYDLRRSETVLRENLPRPKDRTARMLSGKVVGLIGFGRIGKAIHHRLANWGVSVLTSTPRMHSPVCSWRESSRSRRSASQQRCCLRSMSAQRAYSWDA